MRHRHSRVWERVYSLLVGLYPRPFQEKFGPPMKQTFRDLLDDPDMPPSRIWLSVVRDLSGSLFHEHLVNLTGGPSMIRSLMPLSALRVALVVVLVGATPLATGAAGYYVGRSQVAPLAEPTPYPDEATVKSVLDRLGTGQVQWKPLGWIPCPVAVAPGDLRTVTVFVFNTSGEARCPVLP